LISWAFEATPEGLKRTGDVPPDVAAKLPSWSVRKFATFVVIVGILAAGLLAYQYLRTRNTASPTSNAVADSIAQKSIAVLPFESLSEDKANAYFATGIQDEILTRLAKIGEVKVISRTSTTQYQSKPGNLSEIAKQLAVRHVLEGSVQ